jgi:hypothetical protein
MVREVDRQVSTPQRHELRRLLEEADRIIPPAEGYAVTSEVRADNARYVLYPRPRVGVRFTRAALERSGVRYVIVTNDSRPPAFRQKANWFRVLVRSRVGSVVEVLP